MSQAKKRIRAAFRNAVYRRDGYRCRCCGFQSSPERVEEELDAHHITDRTKMPHGGYVAENGIALCGRCHENAECHHQGEPVSAGYAPHELYSLIGSSFELAVCVSELLG